MRCLIVEDDMSLAELVRLEIGDHEVEGVCRPSIAAALVALREAPPDALIIDLTLPDGNGLDVAAEAQRLCPQAPAMVFTGSDATDALSILRRHPNVRAVVAKRVEDGDEVGAMARSLASMISGSTDGSSPRGLTIGGKEIENAQPPETKGARVGPLRRAAMVAALRKAAPASSPAGTLVRSARPAASSEDHRKPRQLRA